jgi:hypothetical protein
MQVLSKLFILCRYMASDHDNFVDVRRRFSTVDGFSFFVAEPPQIQSRQHSRIIGALELEKELCGRTLLYADTYFLASEPEVFVYARHKAMPEEFFSELDFLVEDLTREMPELRREFNLMFNISGKIVTGSAAFPIHPDEKFLNRIRFFRVDFPFGALTIEFSKESVTGDQIQLLEAGLLPRRLDAPLIGCDMTDGPILSNLLTKLHWAAGRLDRRVLESLIAQVTPNSVPA